MKLIFATHRWKPDRHVGVGFVTGRTRVRWVFWRMSRPFGLGFVGW